MESDTPEVHLELARKRALEYVERGDLIGAITSIVCEYGKNHFTAPHQVAVATLGASMLIIAEQRTIASESALRRFIAACQ